MEPGLTVGKGAGREWAGADPPSRVLPDLLDWGDLCWRRREVHRSPPPEGTQGAGRPSGKRASPSALIPAD